MIKIQAPATSANLGPGFDCLGLALSLYNTFLIEKSDTDILIHVEDRFNNPGNLFLQAYHRGCAALGIDDHIRADFRRCDIPVSRGLGSSAAMIAAGLKAASVLHDSRLDDEAVFAIAADMEGHPDNAAPAVFGGLNACMKEDGIYYHVREPLSDAFCFTVLIPDCEVSTEKARAILPKSYPLAAAAGTAAHCVLLLKALETGDLALLSKAARDQLHEPYRSRLIPGYTEVRALLSSVPGVFLISGSGSTCLFISEEPIPDRIQNTVETQFSPAWTVHTVKPCGGVTAEVI